LESTGQTNLLDALKDVLPSFNAQAVGGDTANLVRSASLRGLNPNHTLVLVNGKRRHTSANINADNSPITGANPVDLDLIPVAAIDHVEVLQDGAAAQYGSDAIAGVINIILKNSNHGGQISGLLGQTYKQDGDTAQVSADAGTALGRDGFLHLSADYNHHAHTNRTGPDLRVTSGDQNVGKILGDPLYSLESVGFNAEKPVSDNIKVYGFGTYAHRESESYENYRLPSKLPAVYPGGFLPIETLSEDDAALTGGIKGEALFGWAWDLSSTYGRDRDEIGNIHSANVDLYNATGSTPTSFNVGAFTASEWTNTLDIRRPVELGLWAAPVTVALGVEHRYETYQLEAGDAASRYGSGAQAYPGFLPSDTSNASRNSLAAYVDLSTRITPQWQTDLAARAEHYDDFGDTQTGKVSTRYDFSKAFGLRGTASNGFRAPSLAQEYFSATNVSPTTAIVQLPVNSAGAKYLGVPSLKAEKSDNLSLGFVTEPAKNLHASLDAYQIEITDRIIDSGYVTGATAAQAIAANGTTIEPGVVGVAQFYTNGVDTRTRGIDFATDYKTDYGNFGLVKWTGAVNYNKTTVTKIHDSPSAFKGASLVDPSVISNLTTASPRTKATVGLTWYVEDWSVSLRETRYGHSTQIVSSPLTGAAPYYSNTVRPAFITDVDVGYNLTQAVKIDVGANNLFNIYPTKTIPASRFVNANVYPLFSPYGINGGYYYSKLTVSF